MRVFKCNGKHAGTIPCKSECKAGSDEQFPNGWITIKGEIHNSLPHARLMTAEKCELHYCSRICLSHAFFLTEPNCEPIKEQKY